MWHITLHHSVLHKHYYSLHSAKLFSKEHVLCQLTLFRVTEEVTAKLMESAYRQIEKDDILATRLCTHKDDVELTNKNKLQQLPGVYSDIWL